MYGTIRYGTVRYRDARRLSSELNQRIPILRDAAAAARPLGRSLRERRPRFGVVLLALTEHDQGQPCTHDAVHTEHVEGLELDAAAVDLRDVAPSRFRLDPGLEFVVVFLQFIIKSYAGKRVSGVYSFVLPGAWLYSFFH